MSIINFKSFWTEINKLSGVNSNSDYPNLLLFKNGPIFYLDDNVDTKLVEVAPSLPTIEKLDMDDSSLTDFDYLQQVNDGIIFRFYYVPHFNKWFMSTKSQLITNMVYKDERPINDLLEETLNLPKYNTLISNLDKNYVYNILLIHPEKFQIHKPDTNKLVLVNYFYHEDGKFKPFDQTKTKETARSLNLESSCVWIKEEASDPNGWREFIRQDRDLILCKGDKKYYWESLDTEFIENFRQGAKNIRFAIISNISNQEAIEKYLRLCPYHQTEYDSVKQDLDDLTLHLEKEYVTRYIRHQFIKHHNRHKTLFPQIHKIYIENSKHTKGFRITTQEIYKFLLTLDTKQLYYCLGYKQVTNN